LARDIAQIAVVHKRDCPHQRGRCRCSPSYRAQVWDPRAEKQHRKTFPTYPEAKAWRDDVRIAIRNATVRSSSKQTVAEAARALLEGMQDGSLLDRSGKPYKPSTCRSYALAVSKYLNPDQLARKRVTEVQRADVQDYVDRLRRKGLSPSTIANKLDPIRVVFRRAIKRGEISIDPTKDLDLPAVRGRRERIADRAEASALIIALPAEERAFWATAIYAGLRRGELRALRWTDVELEVQPALIHVRRTWDDVEGEVEVKTDAGFRVVPITAGLRALLVAHKAGTRRSGEDLVFGRTRVDPFVPSTLRSRALRAWGWKEEKNPDAEGPNTVWVKARPNALEPIAPHEGRHSAASYLIEAGLNDLELTATIGHSDSRTTRRIYGHLFPDSSATIAAKLEAYHRAGVTTDALTARVTDEAPERDENPAVAGPS
jgi:integrase